jgi:hypothetical protein
MEGDKELEFYQVLRTDRSGEIRNDVRIETKTSTILRMNIDQINELYDGDTDLIISFSSGHNMSQCRNNRFNKTVGCVYVAVLINPDNMHLGYRNTFTSNVYEFNRLVRTKSASCVYTIKYNDGKPCKFAITDYLFEKKLIFWRNAAHLFTFDTFKPVDGDSKVPGAAPGDKVQDGVPGDNDSEGGSEGGSEGDDDSDSEDNEI